MVPRFPRSYPASHVKSEPRFNQVHRTREEKKEEGGKVGPFSSQTFSNANRKPRGVEERSGPKAVISEGGTGGERGRSTPRNWDA